MNKKIILTVIPALAVLGLLASFFSEPELVDDSLNQPAESQEVSEDQQEILDAQAEVDSHAHNDDQTVDSKHRVFPKSFDYKSESKDLAKLKAEYPRSESQLMDLVLNENEFADAEPHSAAELAQRQKGALKVEALKILMTLDKSKDKTLLTRKLTKIAQTSQDPVMRRIAKAALDSQAKGRPFFSDTVKALGDLPVPE